MRTGEARSGSTSRARVAIAAGVASGLLLASAGAHAGLATAVEFYNPTLRHYFITAYPEEAAALDSGVNVKGWRRTGGQFTVFTDPAPGLQAVCRFFGTPGKGPNSHFYTADAAECEKVKTLPAWTFEAIAFYIPTTGNNDCGSNWPVYRSYYTDNITDANHRFTVDLTAHVRMPQRRGDVLEGIVMCAPVTDEEREADVVRFLEQATLGPTEALVAEVKGKGIEKWLDEQISMSLTNYTQLPYWEPPSDASQCKDDPTPPLSPEKYCTTNKFTPAPTAWEFFRQSKSGIDQVRMRMAHVWHQIFVHNSSTSARAYAFAEFQQRMRDGALGTFEDLLFKYSISPQLGIFQNWAKNVPEHDGIKPNENFARELLQLFTVGVNQLNQDGTLMFNASGQPIASYEQSDVETIARVLTGFSYPPKPGEAANWGSFSFIGDMLPYDQYHDRGAKFALKGRLSLVAGGGAMAEFRTLLRVLVEHPNTPPFISRQLIQKTVTSSPTPQYVTRIAAVFMDDGKGRRGNLAAVTRAILLDPEARGARKIDPEYGRLREPVLFWTAMIRALDVTTDGYQPRRAGWQSGQDLFNAPTVFNYYAADFTLSAANVPAAEFGIFTSSEYLNRANQLNDLLYNVDQSWSRNPYGGWGPLGFVPDAVGTPSPALTTFLADAAGPDILVERLNRLFLHGTMRPEMRKTIVNAVTKLPAADPLRRVKMAINLTLVSVDYQVQK